MRVLKQLFHNNRAWAEEIRARDPEFFERLSRQQRPQYFWLGCSDSRVPANQIVGMDPGEVFVHRNVANVMARADLNALSALQFAVDVLAVRHVIVCGHYGCGGVQAVLDGARLGLVDNWLRHVGEVLEKHATSLSGLSREDRLNRLCELNVVEQVRNVALTTVVQDTWARGQPLSIHGWIYGIRDGLLRDLGLCVSGASELEPAYRAAVARTGTVPAGSPGLLESVSDIRNNQSAPG